VNSQGGGEERARGGDVSSLRDVHVDHLTMLVDRPVHVGPDPTDLDVGLVDEPAVPGQVPTRPGRLDHQRREPLHPPIERHVVDLDATLGEKLFKVTVGQPVPQVPAHRQQDHLGRETEASEPRRHRHRRPDGRRVRFIEPPSSSVCDPSTQQSPRVQSIETVCIKSAAGGVASRRRKV